MAGVPSYLQYAMQKQQEQNAQPNPFDLTPVMGAMTQGYNLGNAMHERDRTEAAQNLAAIQSQQQAYIRTGNYADAQTLEAQKEPYRQTLGQNFAGIGLAGTPDYTNPQTQAAVKANAGYVPAKLQFEKLQPGEMGVGVGPGGVVGSQIQNNNYKPLSPEAIAMMTSHGNYFDARANEANNGGPSRANTWQFSQDGLHKMNTETGDVVALDQSVGAKGRAAAAAKPSMTVAQINQEAKTTADGNPANWETDKMGNRIRGAKWNAAFQANQQAIRQREAAATPAGSTAAGNDPRSQLIGQLLQTFAGKAQAPATQR